MKSKLIVLAIITGLLMLLPLTSVASTGASIFNMTYAQSGQLITVSITGGSANISSTLDIYSGSHLITTNTFYVSTTFTLVAGSYIVDIYQSGTLVYSSEILPSSVSPPNTAPSLSSLEDGLILFALFSVYSYGLVSYMLGKNKRRRKSRSMYNESVIGADVSDSLKMAQTVVKTKEEADEMDEISKLLRAKYNINVETTKRMSDKK